MYCKKNIKKMVQRLKILYKDMSMERVLQERNIVIIPISGKEISKGAYKMCDGIQYIFINVNLSPQEMAETLAHELGHSILHPDVDTFELKLAGSYYFLNKYERQADLFAAEFLLPDNIINDFKGCSDEVGDGVVLSNIANSYRVSEDLVKIKLSNFDNSNFPKSHFASDTSICSNMINSSFNSSNMYL